MGNIVFYENKVITEKGEKTSALEANKINYENRMQKKGINTDLFYTVDGKITISLLTFPN